MRFSTIFAAIAAVPAVSVLAELHVIQVGANNTLTFTPSNITANDGDTIAFQFVSKNHTVTQSTFATPCANFSDNGLDSGFQFIAPGTQTFMQYSFNMTNVTGPLWFYCRQTGHCAQGMVFSINATPEKSFQAFQQNAMASVNPGNTTTGSSSSAATPAASGLPATDGSSSSGSTPSSSSASSASSSSGSPSPSPSNNAAVRVGTTAGVLLSGVGLLAGLVL